MVCGLALIYVLKRFVLRFVALCVVRGALPSCVGLCCVWLLCVLFAVVCRLALRLVALCVGRCGLLSCADLCVALCGPGDGS